jgi:hypothetical protein
MGKNLEGGSRRVAPFVCHGASGMKSLAIQEFRPTDRSSHREKT